MKTNKNNTRSLINEMKCMLQNTPKKEKKLTLESIVFEDDPGYDDMTGYDDYSEPMSQQKNGNITEIINQIRQIALQGIAQLANSPESMEYDTLKKVWQLIDKTVEKNQPQQKEE